MNLFATALWATRLSGFMFGDMFYVLERFATLFTTVLVGWHGESSGVDSAHTLLVWFVAARTQYRNQPEFGQASRKGDAQEDRGETK